MVTLLNHTYMWQKHGFELRTRTNDKYYNDIGLCAQNIDIILGSKSDCHNWEGLCLHLKRKLTITISIYNFCISSNSDPGTWNDNLCDLKLLWGWNNVLFNPTVNIVFGVGSVHNRAIYLLLPRGLTIIIVFLFIFSLIILLTLEGMRVHEINYKREVGRHHQ